MVDDRTFLEVLLAVIRKMRTGTPMMTAKEEFVEDVVKDAIEIFGNDFVFGSPES